MAFSVTDKFRVRLGGNTFIDCGTLITYKGEPLFDLKRHEDGYLGVFFELFDSNGIKLAVVKRNELYPTPNLDRQRYVAAGSRDWYQLVDRDTNTPVVDIKRRSAAQPHELDVSVKLHTADGFLVDASPEAMAIGGIAMIGNTLQGCKVGIAIREDGVGICAGHG